MLLFNKYIKYFKNIHFGCSKLKTRDHVTLVTDYNFKANIWRNIALYKA